MSGRSRLEHQRDIQAWCNQNGDARNHQRGRPADQGGWLAGLNDPQIGKALRSLHHPARDWTVDELAREAAVSRRCWRSGLRISWGDAPMRYLSNWRMQLAKQVMRDGTCNIQEVTTRVGYDSEAAFNRAFNRATGSPPAAWRKGALSA